MPITETTNKVYLTLDSNGDVIAYTKKPIWNETLNMWFPNVDDTSLPSSKRVPNRFISGLKAACLMGKQDISDYKQCFKKGEAIELNVSDEDDPMKYNLGTELIEYFETMERHEFHKLNKERKQ